MSDYCTCEDNKGRCIDCAESEISRLKAELEEAHTELAISIKERIDLGSQLEVARSAVDHNIEEITRLLLQNTSLQVQLYEASKAATDMEAALHEATSEFTKQLSEAKAETTEMCERVLEYKSELFAAQLKTLKTRQDAAMECYNLVNTFATPDILFVLDAIKSKYGLEASK